MRITTKGRYALRAILAMIEKGQGSPVSIRELAEIENISAEFLEQLFYRLRKSGVICSTRGPGGGFSLNGEPEDISIYQILLAVDEGMELVPCLEEDFECNTKYCKAHPIWQNALDLLKEYFSNINLKDALTGEKKNKTDSA